MDYSIDDRVLDGDSVLVYASLLFRLLRGRLSRSEADLLRRTSAGEALKLFPGVSYSIEIDEVLQRLQQLEQSHRLTRQWERHFDQTGNIADEAAAKAFLLNLITQVPVTALFKRPLVCGQTTTIRGSWTHFPMQHHANYDGWTLHFNRSGRVQLRWQDQQVLCQQGDIVVIPPQTACSYELAPRTRTWVHDWYVFQGRERWLQWLDWVVDMRQPAIHQLDKPLGELSKLSNQIINCNHQVSSYGHALQENLFEQLLIRLREQCGDRNTQQHNKSVLVARRYIVDHLAEDLTVDQVAAHCGLSASHLASLFREATGCSLIHWRDQTRMERACNLLRGTGLAVADVADSVGYSDPQHFSRRFKALVGSSPSSFRHGTEGL